MKERTTQKNTINKTDLWTAVILLTFLVSVHRFCAGDDKALPATGAAKELTTPFCPGGACLACFCAAGNGASMPQVVESRYPQ